MKRISWRILFGGVLVVMSSLVYYEQITLFHAPRDTFFYLFRTWLSFRLMCCW